MNSYTSISCSISILLATLCMVSPAFVNAEESGKTNSLAQQICAQYDGITSINCEIRKTSQGSEGTLRLLSRVFYQKPDHLHVENVSPGKRRILADGTNFYYYEDHAKLGYSDSITNLTELWLNSLRNIPGSPLIYVAKVRTLAETLLPSTESYPIRRGYNNENTYIVLSCDNLNRLKFIEVYDTPEMNKLKATYSFHNFQEISPGCFLPCTHNIETFLPDGSTIKESSIIRVISVNKDIAPNLFNPAFYFKGVKFTSNFSDIFADSDGE